MKEKSVGRAFGPHNETVLELWGPRPRRSGHDNLDRHASVATSETTLSSVPRPSTSSSNQCNATKRRTILRPYSTSPRGRNHSTATKTKRLRQQPLRLRCHHSGLVTARRRVSPWKFDHPPRIRRDGNGDFTREPCGDLCRPRNSASSHPIQQRC